MSRIAQTISTPYHYHLVPATVVSLRDTRTDCQNEDQQLLLKVTVRPFFAAASQKRCGILQIILAFVGWILIALDWYLQIGPMFPVTAKLCAGFGAPLLVAGILGTISTRFEKTILIVFCMVVSVLSMLYGFVYLGVSMAAIYFDFSPDWDVKDLQPRLRYIDLCGGLVAFTTIVVAIVQIVICSRTVCRCCVRDEILVAAEADGTLPRSLAGLPSFGYSINNPVSTRDYGTRYPVVQPASATIC